jgi:hypothetical protein
MFRIILACIVLAIKFSLDDYHDNTHYALVGGISLMEMNEMEKECFRLLDNNLLVNDNQFIKYYQCLNLCFENL